MSTVDRMHGVNALPFVSHYKDNENRIPDQDSTTTSNLQNLLDQQDFNKLIDVSREFVLDEGGNSYWFKFCLVNNTAGDQNLVLATSPAVLAEIDFYPKNSELAVFRTGNSKPQNTRDIHSPQFHFNIYLEAGDTQEFYLRVKSRSRVYLTASVWSQPEYLVEKDRVEGLEGLYVGIFLGLMLYSVLLFVWVREPTSLLYMFWSASLLGLFVAVDGRVLQYLLPNDPELAYSFVVILYPLNAILAALFARQFIRLKNYRLLDKAGIGLLSVSILILVVAYLNGYELYIRLCALLALLVVLYFGVITPLYGLIAKRSIFSKYLLVAQLPLMLCIVDRAAFTTGVSTEYLIPFTPKVGLVVSMILMALSNGLLSYREKDEAQRLALEQLKVSNQLKSNYNDDLEAEVENKAGEIRRINSELEQQAVKLLELDDVKSTFFANISHEFRTPLTLIQGPLTGLIEKEGFPDKGIIRGAVKQSKSLQQMVDQLLMLSRFDGESLSLKASRMNVSDVVNTITSQFFSLADSKKIELEFQSKAPKVYAYIDLEKLHVMVNNLISNALKFTPAEGRVIVEVSSSADASIEESENVTDEYVEIRVIDTGEGIPSEELEHVFDRYFQSQTSALVGSGTGTGIGLALVKELTLLHAGEVEVSSIDQSSVGNSETGSGTVFCIRLPIGSAHLRSSEIVDEQQSLVVDDVNPIAVEQHQDDEAIEVLNTDKSGSRPKILVVDDNDDMRTYIRGLLTQDYDVREAIDGIDAENAVKKSLPDLIVTDLMMPKRDGLEFVEELKKNGEFAKIPVIMLTARASLDDRLAGLLGAVDDYLTKPFDARELKARINNLLKKHAQFQAFYQTELLDKGKPEGNVDADDSYISKVRAVVDEHLGDSSFGVNELAEALHVSRATLRRRLAEKANFTPSEFVRHCRLEKARQLSLEGKVGSVKELAISVGFSQASYFSRLYLKTFNTPPLLKN